MSARHALVHRWLTRIVYRHNVISDQVFREELRVGDRDIPINELVVLARDFTSRYVGEVIDGVTSGAFLP